MGEWRLRFLRAANLEQEEDSHNNYLYNNYQLFYWYFIDEKDADIDPQMRRERKESIWLQRMKAAN